MRNKETAMTEGSDELPLFSTRSAEVVPKKETKAHLKPDSSLSAAINVWGEALEDSGKSIHTVKAFTADLRLLTKFVGAGRDINSIGTHDLLHFLDWMLNKRGAPCSPKTYARRVTSLKAFFRWLIAINILDEDPAAAVPQQTVLSPLPQVLTPLETKEVLEVANQMRRGDKPDPRPYTLLSLLLQTGIKKSECLTIHLNHIDLHASEGPMLFIRYSDVRKRYRERKLILDPDWIPAYREYLTRFSPRELLFPYSPRRLEYMLEDIGDAAGLDKHLSFNMCRWTSALLDYMSGMDKNKIRQKLGISKIQWREIGNKLDRLAVQMEAEFSPE
jgi:integrase/recombinase XerD